MGNRPAEIDPLLEPLLAPTRDEEGDLFLSQLIVTHADPVIKGVIRHKLHLNSHGGIEQADADDIHQEVVAQLLAALQRLRQQPAAHPIGDLRGLTAVIAHRACSRWMRQRFPERRALKNRLNYFLTSHHCFAIWQGANGRLIAGLAEWQGRTDVTGAERLKQLSDDEELLSRIRLLKSWKQAEWGGAMTAIFNRLDAPVEVDRLVGVLAEWLQVEDRPIESIDHMEDLSRLDVSGGQPDVARQIEKRIFLQQLWKEVRQLPLNQRAALLLNLRDHQGRGCLALFPALRIATFRQMAEALEMSAGELAELCGGLPLEDSKIAELLQLTRRQVIKAKQDGSAAGSYEIRIDELRAATEDDRALQEAGKLLKECVKLHGAAKHDEAMPLVERSLEIRERILGPDHSDVAANLHAMARIHWNKGEYAKAEPLYQRALTIFERALSPEDPRIAITLNGLAALYWNKGDHVKAEPLAQRALAVMERAFGREHPNVAMVVNSLAIIHSSRGDYAKAEPLFWRAMVIWERTFGPENPNVGMALNTGGRRSSLR